MLYLHLNTWTCDGLGLWLVINISWANFPSLHKNGTKDSWNAMSKNTSASSTLLYKNQNV